MLAQNQPCSRCRRLRGQGSGGWHHRRLPGSRGDLPRRREHHRRQRLLVRRHEGELLLLRLLWSAYTHLHALVAGCSVLPTMLCLFATCAQSDHLPAGCSGQPVPKLRVSLVQQSTCSVGHRHTCRTSRICDTLPPCRARRTSAACARSGSACATAEPWRWSRAAATTAASTWCVVMVADSATQTVVAVFKLALGSSLLEASLLSSQRASQRR